MARVPLPPRPKLIIADEPVRRSTSRSVPRSSISSPISTTAGRRLSLHQRTTLPVPGAITDDVDWSCMTEKSWTWPHRRVDDPQSEAVRALVDAGPISEARALARLRNGPPSWPCPLVGRWRSRNVEQTHQETALRGGSARHRPGRIAAMRRASRTRGAGVKAAKHPTVFGTHFAPPISGPRT